MLCEDKSHGSKEKINIGRRIGDEINADHSK
jgi:hypothetical protein